jgi:hypothetical protein
MTYVRPDVRDSCSKCIAPRSRNPTDGVAKILIFSRCRLFAFRASMSYLDAGIRSSPAMMLCNLTLCGAYVRFLFTTRLVVVKPDSEASKPRSATNMARHIISHHSKVLVNYVEKLLVRNCNGHKYRQDVIWMTGCHLDDSTDRMSSGARNDDSSTRTIIVGRRSLSTWSLKGS